MIISRQTLHALKHNLKKERYKKKKLQMTLKHIQQKLKGKVLIEAESLNNIETCFKKFKSFINLVASNKNIPNSEILEFFAQNKINT